MIRVKSRSRLSPEEETFESLPEEVALDVMAYFDAATLCCSEAVSRQWKERLEGSGSLWLALLDGAWKEVCSSCSAEENASRFASASEAKRWYRRLPRKKLPSRVASSRPHHQLRIEGQQVRWLGALGCNRSVVGDAPLACPRDAVSWKRYGGAAPYGLVNCAYFEATVSPTSESDSSAVPPVVAIGIATRKFKADRKLPGWCAESIGLHSDDGCVYHESRPSRPVATFGPGHVVGCGVLRLDNDDDDDTRGLFFTLDGRLLRPENPLFHLFHGDADLFPVVGLDSHALIDINFGNRPFHIDLFDLFPRGKKKDHGFSSLVATNDITSRDGLLPLTSMSGGAKKQTTIPRPQSPVARRFFARGTSAFRAAFPFHRNRPLDLRVVSDHNTDDYDTSSSDEGGQTPTLPLHL